MLDYPCIILYRLYVEETVNQKFQVRDQGKILYHKSCQTGRRQVRTPRDDQSLEVDVSDVSPLKRTRATTTLCFDNKRCVFCQTAAKKQQLIAFATTQAQSRVAQCLIMCQDQNHERPVEDVDLVAAEVLYHKACYRHNQQQHEPDPWDAIFNQIKGDLDAGKAFTIKELLEKYRELTGDNERKAFSIERSFTTKFSSQITIVQAGAQDRLGVSKDLSLCTIIKHTAACYRCHC